MSFLRAMKISASGLSAERVRMNVISENLANVNTTRVEGRQGPYRRKDVVFQSRGSGVSFDNLARGAFDPEVKAVSVQDVVEDPTPPKKVYDPGHPDADDKGYVPLPNISVMAEMVNMITSTRSFEANATVLNATKSMATEALRIGKS